MPIRVSIPISSPALAGQSWQRKTVTRERSPQALRPPQAAPAYPDRGPAGVTFSEPRGHGGSLARGLGPRPPRLSDCVPAIRSGRGLAL